METGTKGTNSRWLVLALVAVLVFGAAGLAFAAEKGQGRHGAGGQGPLAFLAELNLSDAQKHQVALILKDHRQEARDGVANLMAARKNLFAAVRGPEYNEDAVRQAAREVARFEEEMAVHRAQVFSQVQQLLTPEQKAKVAARRAEFGNKIEQRVQSRLDRLDDWIDRNAAQP